jgi:hypothetical protein
MGALPAGRGTTRQFSPKACSTSSAVGQLSDEKVDLLDVGALDTDGTLAGKAPGRIVPPSGG